MFHLEIPIIKLRKQSYLESDPEYKRTQYFESHCRASQPQLFKMREKKRKSHFHLSSNGSQANREKRESFQLFEKYNNFMRRTQNNMFSVRRNSIALNTSNYSTRYVYLFHTLKYYFRPLQPKVTQKNPNSQKNSQKHIKIAKFVDSPAKIKVSNTSKTPL